MQHPAQFIHDQHGMTMSQQPMNTIIPLPPPQYTQQDPHQQHHPSSYTAVVSAPTIMMVNQPPFRSDPSGVYRAPYPPITYDPNLLQYQPFQ